MNLFLTSAQLFALQDFNWRTGLVCITCGLLWFCISMLLINTVCSLQTSSTAEIMAWLSCTQPFSTILDSFCSFWLVPVKLTDPDVRLKLYQRNSLDQIVQNNSEENTRSLDVTEIITQACCTLTLLLPLCFIYWWWASFLNTFFNPV